MHAVKPFQYQVAIALKTLLIISFTLFSLQGNSSPTTAADSDGISQDVVQFINQLPPTAAGAPDLSSWTDTDISTSPIKAGSTQIEGNDIYVTGSGNNIWKHADGFHYFHSPLVGNGDIVVKVNGLQYIHPWSKAGVMIRQSLSPSSPYAMMLVTPDRGIALQYRSAEGDISYKSVHMEDVQTPIWFKLTRIDNTVIAFRSSDGQDWSLVGSVDIDMAQDALVGLAVTSRHTNKLATAHFSDLSMLAASTQLSNAIEETLQLAEQLIDTLSTTDTSDQATQLEAAINDSQDIPQLLNDALQDLNTEIAAEQQRGTLDTLIADANALLASMSEQSSSQTIEQAETLMSTINTLSQSLNDSAYTAISANLSSQLDTVKQEVATYNLNNDYANALSQLNSLIASIEAGQTGLMDQASALALELNDLATALGETDKLAEAQSYNDSTAQLAAQIEEAERIAALNALLEDFSNAKTALDGLISSIQSGQYSLLPQATQASHDLVALGASINTEKETEAQTLANTVTTLTANHRRTTLGWDMPTERNDNSSLPSDEIDAYIIRYTMDGVQQNDIVVASANATNYIFDSLAPGDYSFTIITRDTAGQQSSPSEVAAKTVY